MLYIYQVYKMYILSIYYIYTFSGKVQRQQAPTVGSPRVLPISAGNKRGVPSFSPHNCSTRPMESPPNSTQYLHTWYCQYKRLEFAQYQQVWRWLRPNMVCRVSIWNVSLGCNRPASHLFEFFTNHWTSQCPLNDKPHSTTITRTLLAVARCALKGWTTDPRIICIGMT